MCSDCIWFVGSKTIHVESFSLQLQCKITIFSFPYLKYFEDEDYLAFVYSLAFEDVLALVRITFVVAGNLDSVEDFVGCYEGLGYDLV